MYSPLLPSLNSCLGNPEWSSLLTVCLSLGMYKISTELVHIVACLPRIWVCYILTEIVGQKGNIIMIYLIPMGHCDICAPSLFTPPSPSSPQMKDKFGPVFSIQMGLRKIVVLCGYEMVKEALVTQADLFAERPDIPLFKQITRGNGTGQPRLTKISLIDQEPHYLSWF